MGVTRRISAVLVFLLCLLYAGGAQGVITLSPTEIKATNLTVKKTPYADVRAWGAKCDGTTDDSGAFQAAINHLRDLPNGPGGRVLAPLGQCNLGTTGITLYEGIQLEGSGMSDFRSGAPAGGTWLFYSGTGNAITIDGEWTGFDARRQITISNLNIKVQAGVTAGIWADFLTGYTLDRVHIRGASTYGVYLINSYNGSIRNSKFEGTGTGLYMTIKAAPDDVFSGQLLIEDADFWNNTDKGLHIESSVNVMAQIQVNKSHFKANPYGAYLGGNVHRVNFIASHFEGNTTNDLYIASTITRGPHVLGSHFNNTNAVYKIDNQGSNAVIEGNEFTGGGTGYGIKINGENNHIVDNVIYGNANSLLIDTSATFTRIGKNEIANYSGSRMTDNGNHTEYEGELVIESAPFTLSAAASSEIKMVTGKDYWIKEVKIVYPVATSVDAGISLKFGHSGNLSEYVNHTSDSSQAAYTVVTPTMAARYIQKGRVLTFRSEGGKAGGGTAKFVAVLVPFPMY